MVAEKCLVSLGALGAWRVSKLFCGGRSCFAAVLDRRKSWKGGYLRAFLWASESFAMYSMRSTMFVIVFMWAEMALFRSYRTMLSSLLEHVVCR